MAGTFNMGIDQKRRTWNAMVHEPKFTCGAGAHRTSQCSIGTRMSLKGSVVAHPTSVTCNVDIHPTKLIRNLVARPTKFVCDEGVHMTSFARNASIHPQS